VLKKVNKYTNKDFIAVSVKNSQRRPQ